MSTAAASSLPSLSLPSRPERDASTARTHQVPPATLASRLEIRFALRATSLLDEASIGHDIEQRLRVAREQAVTRARIQRRAAASGQVAGSLGSRLAWLRSPWGLRLAGTVPFALLVAGLVGIAHVDLSERASAAAEIDSGLLADELPPAAYADPAFAAFLEQPRP